MSQEPTALAAPSPVSPPPWGVLGSLAWGAIGILVWFAAQLAVVTAIMVWRETTAPGSVDMQKLGSDGFLLALTTIVAGPAWFGAAALAARWRGWRVRDYLALIWPRRADLIFGFACMAALLLSFDALTYLLGRDVVPRFMTDAYLSARSAGALPLFFIAVVIVAPITEEVAFRGLLFRGLSESWLGIAGTLVLTSAMWAMMHVQYDSFTLAQIFVIGLLLGWLRWVSGSTLLTIILHVIANFVACLQATIKVEYFS